MIVIGQMTYLRLFCPTVMSLLAFCAFQAFFWLFKSFQTKDQVFISLKARQTVSNNVRATFFHLQAHTYSYPHQHAAKRTYVRTLSRNTHFLSHTHSHTFSNYSQVSFVISNTCFFKNNKSNLIWVSAAPR